jgi:hypothetical protein
LSRHSSRRGQAGAVACAGGRAGASVWMRASI